MERKILFFLVIISLNLFGISNQAKIDIIKIKVQEKVKKGDYSSIIPLIEEWKSLDKNVPKSLAFFEGKAYYGKKDKTYEDYIASYENLERYINQNGKTGRYYTEALEIIIEIESKYKQSLEEKKLYTKYKNRVVIDNENSLMWQDDFDVVATSGSPEGLLSYCKNLELAGYKDWRVPNANEILTTVDYSKSPAIKVEFKNIKTLDNRYPFFYIDELSIKYYINSFTGQINTGNYKKFFVRCVRTHN